MAFEGLEGCGKSTQLKLLATALRRHGLAVTATREPGGTALGRRLRQVLLHDDTEHPSPAEEFLMFLLDRQAHLRKVILPALAQGGVVLSDRYHYSTLAYQEPGGKALSPHWVDFSWEMIGGVRPNLVVLLDMPPQAAFQRLAHRTQDKIERRGETYFRRVRQRFLTLAKQEPERFLVLKAAQPVEELHQLVLARVKAKLA